MDPNAALESILRGHMMADHVAALHDWLLAGGFQPTPVLRPVDVTPGLASLPFNTDIGANKHGVFVAGSEGAVAFTWRELMRIADALED
jgi:hypothetical protein